MSAQVVEAIRVAVSAGKHAPPAVIEHALYMKYFLGYTDTQLAKMFNKGIFTSFNSAIRLKSLQLSGNGAGSTIRT
jgi:hypothetical protein